MKFWRSIFIFTYYCWSRTIVCQEISDRSRPNIVVILADDLGIGDVGCFGNSTIRTPNIDSLCQDGAKLSHHVVAAPVCTPSRSALLTGRYPKRIGIHGDDNTKAFFRLPVSVWTPSSAGLPEEEVTFAEVAKTAGYQTGIIGKWHLGLHCPGKPNCHSPINQGFDYWWGFPLTNLKDFGDDIPLKWVGRQWNVSVGILSVGLVLIATAILERKLGVIGPRTTGFFVFLAFAIVVPYFILMNLKFWNSMIIRNEEVVERPIELDSLSSRFAKETDAFIANSVGKNEASSSSSPFLLFLSFAHTHTALHALPQHKDKSAHGPYGDAVEELDWQVGQLLESLRRHSATDNTLVYFSSDHGGHLEETTWNSVPAGGWNGGFKGGKFQTFEGGIRVPTAVKWPGVVQSGSEVAALTSNMDVMATILDVLRVEGHPSHKIDGKSLMPLFAAAATTTTMTSTTSSSSPSSSSSSSPSSSSSSSTSFSSSSSSLTTTSTTSDAATAADVSSAPAADAAKTAAGISGDAATAVVVEGNPEEVVVVVEGKAEEVVEVVEGNKETNLDAVQKDEEKNENNNGGKKEEENGKETASDKTMVVEAKVSSSSSSSSSSSFSSSSSSPPIENQKHHSLLLHHCDFLLNSATYEPKGPRGDIWKVHWRVPKWVPGTQGCGFRCDCFTHHEDVDPPLLYNLASDPYEERPLPLTSGRLRLLDNITKMARAKDAEMRGAAPIMTTRNIYLNPFLMPFCREFPYIFCKDEVHIETYLY